MANRKVTGLRKRLPKNSRFITGIPKRGKIRKVQSVLIPRGNRKKSSVETKVRFAGFKTKGGDTTNRFYRFRQRDPRDFKKRSFRTRRVFRKGGIR